MRIGIATEGSTGDLQPYLALARALHARGHQVRLFSARYWEEKVAAAGVPFVDSGNPFDDAETRRFAARLAADRNPFQQLRRLFREFVPASQAQIQRLVPELRGLDLLVAHVVAIPAIAAALASEVPLVLGHLAPAFLYSRDGLPMGPRLGRLGNALLWKLLRALVRHYTDPPLNEVLQAAGLPPMRDVLLSLNDRARRVLIGVSPSVLPRDSGWSEQVEVTGYWFLEEPAWTPPPELERFMADGASRPAVISFGSMVGADPAATTRTLVDAVQRAGCRAVLQAGWADLGDGAPLPESILRVGYVPHDWLFSRAACVVHHGGAGTTAAALRAGVPQVTVWHIGDQQGWGQMVARRGVGPPGRSHRRLAADWLAGALRRALDDREMQARASELGRQIRGEDGLGAAVRAIEALGPAARHPNLLT
jgi:sterol 3beta-glucosyltransferase